MTSIGPYWNQSCNALALYESRKIGLKIHDKVYSPIGCHNFTDSCQFVQVYVIYNIHVHVCSNVLGESPVLGSVVTLLHNCPRSQVYPRAHGVFVVTQ